MISRVTITIDTENDSFDEDLGGEVSDILAQIAEEFDEGNERSRPIRDSNGNRVGQIEIE